MGIKVSIKVSMPLAATRLELFVDKSARVECVRNFNKRFSEAFFEGGAGVRRLRLKRKEAFDLGTGRDEGDRSRFRPDRVLSQRDRGLAMSDGPERAAHVDSEEAL